MSRPAGVANIVNESALLAARQHQDWIEPENVCEALARVVAGTGSERLIRDDERYIRATYEAGHALLTLLVAQRLRERREREEQLIVSAAEALGRRTAAREEAGAAGRVLSAAIQDLVTMGFTVADIAEVLDVAVNQLGDQPAAPSANGRSGKAGSAPQR